MLNNYLKIALRNLFKNKIYSFINIFGLSIGITGFILITILIKNELSFDSFQKKADRIYRVVEIQNQENIGKLNVAVTMGPLAKALKDYYPEVESSARLLPSSSLFFKVGDEGFYEKDVSYVDPSIFEIFSIPFIKGDPKNSLKDPFTMIITESIADKYFGKENPLNKTISVSSSYGESDYKITGVIKDYPENSHINFSVLASLKTVEDNVTWLSNWHSNGLATYVLLNEGADPNQIEKRFSKFVEHYIPPDETTGEKNDLEMYLQPIKDVHLYSDDIIYQTYNYNQGSISDVYIFSAIALFIILIACINFMNLATARSSKRIKEIGMRKVLGSTRRAIVSQFLSEAILISLISLLLSFLFVEIMLPVFKDIFDNRIIFSYLGDIPFFLELIGIALLVGIISGSYPAIFLSKFHPAESLKSSASGKREGAFLRKILVVLQFSIAISLIICTGIVINQMDFLKNKDLGFNTEHVLYIPLRNKESRDKIELLKNRISQNSRVKSVAAGSGLSGASGTEGTESVTGTNGQLRMVMRRSYVDFDYIKTMEMEIVKGRDFSRDYSLDSSSSVIINEAAVRKFGWNDPIGKQFEGEPVKTVIGVVKDFNFFDLHSKIGPLIMSVNPQEFRYLLIRVNQKNLASTVEYIEQSWKDIIPGKPVDYSFLDQHFDETYKNEQRTGKLFGFFSSFAIFIACLGLFGLASYTAEQKTKEIGIRKVLGASTGKIILMLSKDFVKLVSIAGLIAIPISYYVMNEWLKDFAYRVNIKPGTFILAGLLAFVIAFATICFQAIKAATANPVKSLKYE